jgi:hypothetical protein
MEVLHLRGPAKLQKQTHTFLHYQNPDILYSSVVIQGDPQELLRNHLTILPFNPQRYMIHHAFRFLRDGELHGGHWYDTTLSLIDIQNLLHGNLFVYHHIPMNATYTFELSERARKKIMNLV